MTKIMALLALAAVAGGEPAGRARFNGAWLMDLASNAGPAEVERLELRNGWFARGSGSTGVRVEADGRPYRVNDDGYVDSISVEVLSPERIVEKDWFRGRLRYSIAYTASDDGATLTRDIVDFSKPDGKPITTKIVETRVGTRGVGSAVSGDWRTERLVRDEASLIERISIEGDVFTSSGAGGRGYSAIIGGAPVPIRGEAESSRIVVSMPDADTVSQELYHNGAHTVSLTMTMLPDGKTIKVAGQRLRDGHAFGWLLRKR